MSTPSLVLAKQQADVVRRDRLIRLAQVLALVGVGKSTWYSLMAEGKAPQCVRVTPRCVAWSEQACLQWVQDRLSEAGSASGRGVQ